MNNKLRIRNRLTIFFNIRTIAALLAMCLLLVGGIVVERASLTVVKTSAQLFIISDNIQFYNDSYVKTQKMTDEVREQFRLRQENFYESDDFVVRTFSNSFVLVKLLIFVLAIGAIPLVPAICFYKIRELLYILLKRMRATRIICRKYERSNFKGDVVEFEKYLRQRRREASQA